MTQLTGPCGATSRPARLSAQGSPHLMVVLPHLMVVLAVPRLPQPPVAIQVGVCPGRRGGQPQAEGQQAETHVHAGKPAGR